MKMMNGGKQSVVLLLFFLYGLVRATWLGVNIPIRLADRRGDICTSASLSTIVTSYAINIEPEVVSPNVERISLYVCGTPRTYKRYWYCNKQPPCALTDGVVIFSWAKGVPEVPLPLNVGFRLGGRTPWKYFVLQVFYSDDGNEGGRVTDMSQDEDNGSDGVSVQLTKKTQKYVAGIYTLSARNTKARVGQPGCPYHGNKMVPFAYRSEIDNMENDQMLAYRIQSNKWSLINTPAVEEEGQGGAFEAIPSDDMMVIKPGDFLTASWAKAVPASVVAAKGVRVEEHRLHLLYYTNNNVLASNMHTTCKLFLTPNLVQELPASTKVTMNTKSGQRNATNSEDMMSTSPSVGVTTSATTESLITVAATTAPMETTKTGVASVSVNYGRGKNQPTSSTPPHRMGARMVVKGSGNFQAGQVMEGWWSAFNLSLGTISDVGMSKDGRILYTLHRGDRNITWKSYDDEYYYKDFDKPISHSTIALINTTTQQLKQTSGSGMFYLPYSLTVDGWGNVWITDVGLHQVLKFSGTLQKLLVLGKSAIPGTDARHFCKPSDVAVDGKGNVYVSDGLCNQRIMKFDHRGHFLKEWGDHLNTPHNIVVDDEAGMLYVFDIHYHSIVQYDTTGRFIKLLRQYHVGQQRIQSIAFNGNGGSLYVLASESPHSQCLGQIISTESGDVSTSWQLIKGHINGPCHLAISADERDWYVASGVIVSKITLDKVETAVKDEFPDERVVGDNYYSEIRIIKASEDENHIRTALIVVVVLGTPVVLSILMMLVQYIILKVRHRKVRMKRNLYKERRGSGVWCHGCCVTRKHYFQSSGGMEEFMVNSNCEDSGSEEELFARKT